MAIIPMVRQEFLCFLSSAELSYVELSYAELSSVGLSMKLSTCVSIGLSIGLSTGLSMAPSRFELSAEMPSAGVFSATTRFSRAASSSFKSIAARSAAGLSSCELTPFDSAPNTLVSGRPKSSEFKFCVFSKLLSIFSSLYITLDISSNVVSPRRQARIPFCSRVIRPAFLAAFSIAVVLISSTSPRINL